MIHLSYEVNPFAGAPPRTWTAEWAPGVTARSLAPDDASELAACWRNGELLDDEAWDRELSPGDSLRYLEIPGIFGQIALWGVKAAVAAASAAKTLAVLKFIGTLAASFAIGKLLGPRKAPLTPSNQDSPTYRFGGITSNRQAEGAPIPIIYGDHDTGGLEIAKYTTTSVDGTDLWVLLALSDGPVHSVGGLTVDSNDLTSENGDLPDGLQINGQPAGNYDGVRCWTRLGTEQQASIPGFESSAIQYAVDQTLSESLVPGPGNVEITPGVYTPGDAELDKWDTLVTHDFTTELDAFEALIDFPQGLFAVSTTSVALQQNQARFQIRYIELSGGSPTGDYVVLPPETPVVRAKSSPFLVAFRHDVVDPATYGPAVPGLYATMGTGESGQIASPVGFVDKQKSEVAVSVSIWTRLNNPATSPLSQTFRTMFSHLGTNRGWGIEIEKHGDSTAASITHRVRWTYGQGAAFETKTSNPFFAPNDGEIHQWGFSYFWESVASARLEIYFDGAKKTAISISNPMLLAPTAAINLATGGDWDIDDFRYWQRSLQAGEMAGQYASGVGASSSGTEPGIVVSVDFDTASGVSAADATVNGNDVVFAGGALVSSLNVGKVTTVSQGTPQRATYRVEIQRLDDDDSEKLDKSTATWAEAKAILFDEFRYPGTALIGVRIRATDQLSGNAPTVTVRVEGRPVPIWDGVDEEFPSFVQTYTRNPSWIALDVATNEGHGLAPYFLLERDPVLSDFEALAAYCDEWVPTGEELFDATTASSFAYTYSAGTVTLVFNGVTEFPVYEVGDGIAILDFTFPDWNAPDNDAIILTAVDYDSTTDVLTLTGDWYTTASNPIPINPSGTPAGSIERRERRFLFDGIYDRPENGAWDALVALLQTCRAKPITAGRTLGVFIDRPRDSVGILGMGSIKQGTFSTAYSSIKERPNAVAIEILDRDDNFARTWVEREHSTVTDPTSQESFRRSRIRREGVTRRSQALRDATYQLNVAFILNRSVQFKLDTEGLYLKVGDRFGLAHDVPQWGFSGRLRSVTSTTQVALDREVTIDGSSTYGITIQDLSGGTSDTQTVTTGAGTYAAGTTITVASAFAFSPAAGDNYSFGVLGSQVKDFQVTDLGLDPRTLERTVDAIEYADTVYDDAFGPILESPSALTPPPSEDDIPGAPLSLSVDDGMDVTGDGTAAQFIDVSWDLDGPSIRNVAGVELWLEDTAIGVPRKVADIPGTPESYRLAATSIADGGTYRVYVRPYSLNRRMRYVKANPYVPVTLAGLAQPPNKPLTAATRQAGDQVVYNWTPGSTNNRVAEEIRNGGWILGQRIAENVKGANNYGPTASWLSLPTNSAGVSVPDSLIRSLGHTGQPGPARKFSTDFDPPGEIMYEVSIEDEGTGWAGATLSNLAVTGTTPDATLSFSAGTSAYVEWDVTDLPVTGWYYVFMGYVAENMHPLTWDEMTWPWDSIEGKRWTWEGSLYGEFNGMQNVGLRPFITTSKTGTVSTSLKRYIPGRHYGRSFRFRLQFTRPSTDYDIILRRMAIRIVRPHEHNWNPLRSEAFA